MALLEMEWMEDVVRQMGKPSSGRSGVHAEQCKICWEAKEPAGEEFRAPVVAMRRVTIAEPRGAGKWKANGKTN